MCLVMSLSHGAKNTWSIRACSGSQQFQKMSLTRSSMSTFRRPTLSTPTLCWQILQRLLKWRSFGTLTRALFLRWLTCLLEDLLRISLDLWMSFFCRSMGAPILMLQAHAVHFDFGPNNTKTCEISWRFCCYHWLKKDGLRRFYSRH